MIFLKIKYYFIKTKYFIKNLFLILLCLFLVSGCSTVQTISTPPEAYYPDRPTTDKELISSWQHSLIKIKEWQMWYDIQVGSNYFYTNIQTNN